METTNTKKSGLAIASLVFGILSVTCLSLLAGIPAIILGHIAYNRTRRQPEQFGGAGLAIAGFVTGYASILVTAIALIFMFSALLPALSKAKMKAQRINCVSNLKQIGLAARVWASDNGDLCPWNVPVSKGGTFDYCEKGPDGFDVNAWRHFQVLSREMGQAPRILICPADTSKTPAVNFEHLTAQNVSYQLRTGTNISDTHPDEVMAVCPIHNNVLMCDGSVRQMPMKKPAR